MEKFDNLHISRKMTPYEQEVLKKINQLLFHYDIQNNTNQQVQINNNVYTIDFSDSTLSSINNGARYINIDNSNTSILLLPAGFDYIRRVNSAEIVKLYDGNFVTLMLNDKPLFSNETVDSIDKAFQKFQKRVRRFLDGEDNLPQNYHIDVYTRNSNEAEWNAENRNLGFIYPIYFAALFAFLVDSLTSWNWFWIIPLVLVGFILWLNKKITYEFTSYPIFAFQGNMYITSKSMKSKNEGNTSSSDSVPNSPMTIKLENTIIGPVEVPNHWREEIHLTLAKSGCMQQAEYSISQKRMVRFNNSLSLEKEGSQKLLKLWRSHLVMLIFMILLGCYLIVEQTVVNYVLLQYQKYFTHQTPIEVAAVLNELEMMDNAPTSELNQYISQIKNQFYAFNGSVTCMIKTNQYGAPITENCSHMQLVDTHFDKTRYDKLNQLLANSTFNYITIMRAVNSDLTLRLDVTPPILQIADKAIALHSPDIIEAIKLLTTHDNLMNDDALHHSNLNYLLDKENLLRYIEIFYTNADEKNCAKMKEILFNNLLFNSSQALSDWESLIKASDNESIYDLSNQFILVKNSDTYFIHEAKKVHDNAVNNLVNPNKNHPIKTFWMTSKVSDEFYKTVQSSNLSLERLTDQVNFYPLDVIVKIRAIQIKDDKVLLEIEKFDSNLTIRQMIILAFICILFIYLFLNHLVKFILSLRYPKTMTGASSDKNQLGMNSTSVSNRFNITKDKPKLDLQGKHSK
ncbi:hypothetical protein [Thorsellia anophelis]|uniref:Uncharacterized protein n=1 Tax=Thorsellia anophelis DSM 18579 TaxID=1123402 RepID=A0A1I0D239_9GAMM|nr:hypothetical protein [Thorsellia anophelis]SET26142.1 hypothetical protein SAMN02583745_01831 [Thorsellia anophelis DSM 18579]